MNNTYIAQYLGTPPRESRLLDFVDRVARKLIPWLRINSEWRGMASAESRMNSFHLLSQVLTFHVPGDVVEIGCNSGETTVVLQRVLHDLAPDRELYAFDSFTGVPKADPADENVYKEGDMAADLNQFFANFDRLGLKRPRVYKGWFNDTLPTYLPSKIAFAMIDADMYSSTLQALAQIYDRLSPGAVCLLGVYWQTDVSMPGTTDRRYKSPGVKKATDEFLADKPESVDVLYAGNYTMGFFRKQ